MLKPERDPTRFFVLSAIDGSAAPAADAPVVHLREIEIADYLRGRPIVVRRGEHEIEFREFARWGEPLEQGIARVLREDLLARGAASAVVGPGLRGGLANAARELKVRVLACEGRSNGTVNFRAVWELTSGGAKAETLAHGDFRPDNLRWDGKSEAQLAGGLSDAVAGLSAEIAAALKK